MLFRFLLLSAALLFAAASPARAEWREASTSHYLIYADMPANELQSYAERLERYDRVLRMLTNSPEPTGLNSNRLAVYLVASMSDVQALADDRNVGGFYRGDASGPIAVSPRSADYMKPREILFHEYAHHMLMGSSSRPYPSWLNEGLPEFFATVKINSDGGLTLGSPLETRAYSIMSMSRTDVENLLTTDQRKLSQFEREQQYSRGWLLVHYLLLGGKRPGQLDKYLNLLDAGKPSLEAGREAFGDLAKLDRELDSYRERKGLPALRLPPDKLPVGKIDVRTLRPGEAQILPTRLRSALGVDEKGAQALVAPARKVAAQYPDDPWVQRTLAEIEYDAKNYNQAEAAADKALALQPGIVGGLIYKGLVHLQHAQATKAGPEAWKEARSWFLKANRADPEYARPLVEFYDSFITEKQPPSANAFAGLKQAARFVPQDGSLGWRIAGEQLRQGDLKAARTTLEPLAHSPHAAADNPALKILDMIDAGKSATEVAVALKDADKKPGDE